MQVSLSIKSPFTFDNITTVCETVPPDVHAVYPVPFTAVVVPDDVEAVNNSKVVAVGLRL